MSFEKAKAHLKKYALADRITEFDVSSATVAQAALAIGCREAEIAKTLSFAVGEETVLIVAAGDVKIDNAKFKAQFHTKAKMLPFDSVEEKTGHAPGGVCPFGINSGVRVFADQSLRRFETVYPAAGSANSAVRLSVDELYTAAECEDWVDVCKATE